MPQSLAQIYLHIVFSTKDRKSFLKDPTLRIGLLKYLVGISRNLDCPSLQIGGVEDHVHILCRFSRSIKIEELLRQLKRDSSVWVKQQPVAPRDFHWQSGYGAFSVSPSHVDGLIQYIANQEEHHHKESFQDELRRLCKMYGVEIDERYVWD